MYYYQIKSINRYSPYIYTSTPPSKAKNLYESFIRETKNFDKAVMRFLQHVEHPCLYIENPGGVTILTERKSNIIEFVYQKDNGETQWRKIDLISEDDQYLKGFDIEDGDRIKSFLRYNIVGGRILSKSDQ